MPKRKRVAKDLAEFLAEDGDAYYDSESSFAMSDDGELDSLASHCLRC